MLRDHARRVRDSHRMGAKAAGLDEVASEQDGSDAGDDNMGDIIISGDITNTYLPPPSPAQLTPSPAQLTPPTAQTNMSNAIPSSAPSATGLSNLAKAAVIGASLLSGGVGATIPLVANLLLNKPAAPTPPPIVESKPQGYEIRLVPEAQGVGSSK
jgi:hypothetical protein